MAEELQASRSQCVVGSSAGRGTWSSVSIQYDLANWAGGILFRCESFETGDLVGVVVILGVEEAFRLFCSCIKHNPAFVLGVDQTRLVHTGFNKPVSYRINGLI